MHPAEKYVDDVLSGKIVTGEFIKLACERYRNDIATGIDRGIYFNRNKAAMACKFFQLVKHYKGKWAGKTFVLEPWQAFVVWNIFGFYNADGTRRYRKAYTQVSRKNGKSTFGAVVGLLMQIADGESGAEVYVGATKLAQAKITFNDAKHMVRKSPALKKYITVFEHNLHATSNASKFEPVASDSDKLDGLNPHCGIIDEYHAHKDDSLYNVLESGMGARQNPLMFVITTAGFNKQSPCYKLRELCINVLKGVLIQEDLFAAIYELDKDDDWEDSTNWIKSNPSMSEIDTIANFLDTRYTGVKNDPSKLVDFLTKNLNLWVDASDVWVEDSRWMANNAPATIEVLTGATCYAALDLSSNTDITAFVVNATVDGKVVIVPFFFIPTLTAEQRVKKDGVNYDVWIRAGLIEETPGDVVDYDYIRRRITGYYVEDNVVKHDHNCLNDLLNIKQIGFDRWNSSQLVNDLTADGMEMVAVGQGFGSMSTPTKELEKLALSNQLAHGGNPVLRWMMANVEIKRDAAGNIKPDKGKSSEKIDGVVASIMALALLLSDSNNVNDDIFNVKSA